MTPVDLLAIAAAQGIHTVQLMPMIHSASIAPDRTGFSVQVKSTSRIDFDLKSETRINLAKRQRFSLAHEIVHTLFYCREASTPIKDPGAPVGGGLEALCQFGAGLLLVPEGTLRHSLGPQRRIGSIDQLTEACERFAVSPEVLLRRIEPLKEIVATDYAAVFAVGDGPPSEAVILASCYNPSLHLYLAKPPIRSTLALWIDDLELTNPKAVGDKRWWRSVNSAAGLEFTLRPWSQRQDSFFLQARLVIL
jgi:hypothetical protein